METNLNLLAKTFLCHSSHSHERILLDYYEEMLGTIEASVPLLIALPHWPNLFSYRVATQTNRFSELLLLSLWLGVETKIN